MKRKNSMKQTNLKDLKGARGITLIALVITIIVLLILAGVTIATLTGENGILTRANDAKEQTEKTSAKERVAVEVAASYGIDGKIDPDLLNENLKNVEGLETELPISLPATVVVDGQEIMIGANGSVGTVTRISVESDTTKPYLPSIQFKQVEGTNLDNGIVATDGTNYWTWIEVPTNIYENPTYNGGTAPIGANDYDSIEIVLNNYTKTLLSRNNYTDEWYDYLGTSYDGINQYSPVKYIIDSTKYNTAKEYYGELYIDANGNIDTSGEYVSEKVYYAKITDKLNDVTGCGLTYEEYNNLKRTMLSSIYINGGFWIGQYETGASSYPATSNNDSRIIIIQEGAYPYNFITCSNAQIRSSNINSGNYTSSLMFGIQWDLVLKYLETNGEDISELINNSSNWGNYNNIEFEIDRGGYTLSSNSANSFTLIPNGSIYKKNTGMQLLTIGATDRNMKMNIYDLAGNLNEWTLEKSTDTDDPCVSRGGTYAANGNEQPASSRSYDSTSRNDHSHGFRITIF